MDLMVSFRLGGFDSQVKVGTVIQARMGSTRLPGKVLFKLPYNSETTVLEHIVDRAKKVTNNNICIVATSTNPLDNSIENLCNKKRINCYRGNEQNVLARYLETAQRYCLDHIIRLTGDNPCNDSQLIEEIIKIHLQEKNDYTKTSLYPLGTNVEIISYKALECSDHKSTDPLEQESVTLYVSKNPEKFKIKTIQAPAESKKPTIRLTLDVPQDYALLNYIFECFAPRPFFAINDIIKLFEKKPWLRMINEKVTQKKPCNSLEEELEEIEQLSKKQDLNKAKEFIAFAKKSLLKL